jgi:hypothetical protein
MNEKLVDMVFKVGILMVGIIFLVVYFLSSQNGRFQKFDSKILDTRTGAIHESLSVGKEGVIVSTNIVTGETKIIKWKEITGKEHLPAPGPAPVF